VGENPDRVRQEIEQTRAQLERDNPADRIRDDIDETRAQIGDTMGALGHKADVKGRMKESISDKKDSLVGTVSSGKDAVVGKADSLVGAVTGVVPDKSQVAGGARKVGLSKENPLGLAVGAAAVGFIAGLLVPTTRVEEEKLAPMASDVRERAMEAGQEAVERGKQVAQDAVETAKESGQEHAQEMREQVGSNS